MIDYNREIVVTYNGTRYSEKVQNVKVANLTPEQLKEALNDVSAKYAFWSTLHNSILTTINRLNVKYDLWYVEAYNSLGPSKMTETAKKNKVYLENPDKVKNYFNKLSDLKFAKDNAHTLVKSYEMQSKTLQTISAILRQELAVLRTGGGTNDI